MAYGHRPKVSIVVLSHRLRSHPAMVRAALDSAVNQSYGDVEVRLTYHPENWPTKLNDAVAKTRGEWVIILCDDDLLHPDYVKTCLEAGAEYTDCVYTDRRVFRDWENPEDGFHFRMHGKELSGPDAYRIALSPGSFLFGQSLPMTCMIKRDLWDELKGHDPEMPHSDTEMWYRMTMAGARFVYVPQALFYYREHHGQMCRIVNTMPMALRQFHRKHFLAFGVTFGPDRGYEVPGEMLPIERRLGYQAAYHTPLTTTGYMATERRTLPQTAKIAIQLKQREASQAVDMLIDLALHEVGLDAKEGWKLDGNYEAVREVPNAPDDLTLPATVATVAVDQPPGLLALVPNDETGMAVVS